MSDSEPLNIILLYIVPVIVFQYRNQDRFLINTISVLHLTQASVYLIWYANLSIPVLFIQLCHIGLLIAYTARIVHRKQRTIMDYVKLAAVALPTLQFLIPLNNWFSSDDSYRLADLLWAATLGLTFMVFLFDRAFKRYSTSLHNAMKNKLVIAFVIQTILMGMFLVYALVQRTQAIRSEYAAVQSLLEAQENKWQAVKAMKEAQEQMELSRVRLAAMEKAIEDCQAKKK
jgi:hypothetical protein